MLEPGEPVEIRRVPDADDEMIVLDRVGVPVGPVRDLDHTPLERDSSNLALKKTDAPQQLSDGVHDVGEVDVARGHLVEHGCKQEEVVRVDQSDVNVIDAAEALLECEGRVEASEPAAQDHDVRSHGRQKGATSQKTLMASRADCRCSNSSE